MTHLLPLALVVLAACPGCDEPPPDDTTIADLCAERGAAGLFRLTLTASAIVRTHPPLTDVTGASCDGGGCGGATFYTAALQCPEGEPIVLSVHPSLVSTLEVVGEPAGRTLPAPHCVLPTRGPSLIPECVAMADCQLRDRVVVGRFVTGSFRVDQIED